MREPHFDVLERGQPGWLRDATEVLTRGGYQPQGCLAQVLDAAPHPEGRGVNCVLSDGLYSIGAVILYNEEFRDATAIEHWIILPVTFDVVMNVRLRQFALEIREFERLERGGAEVVGNPRCVMECGELREQLRRFVVG